MATSGRPANSQGSIHVADNSVTAINDALQQLLFYIDELRGTHLTTNIVVGPHTHADTEHGGPVSVDHDDLTNVTANQHHDEDHHARHESGGSDPIKLDDLATPDDNTDLNATTGHHGLLPKLSGNSTDILDGTGAFVAAGASSEQVDVANIEGSTQEQIWEQVIAGSGITITELAQGNAIQLDSSGGTHSAFTYFAAQIEPLAIEKLQSGTFTYVIGASETKLIVNSFWTRLGSAGRWEIRDPRAIMPLRDITITGLDASSTTVIIDPSLPTYTDARTTFYDRINTIATTAPKYLSLSTAGTSTLFLPGPYGNIITSVNVFDATWVIFRPYGTSLGWNLHDENGDLAANAERLAHATMIPVSKNVVVTFELGTERALGDAEGSITYLICPSTWGKVTDPNSYIFRDDFLGASLDTGSTWTRSQSTAGNVEIRTDFAWCKFIGNTVWGDNGAHSQASTSRVAGKKFECHVLFAGNGANDGGIVGWNDGSGQSYSDMAHGVNFNNNTLTIYEDGNSRGTVGSGFSTNTIYRVRITLDSAGANSAKYEIQGGTQYATLGGSSWTDITPGTTSSSTTPLTAGFSAYGNTQYISDVKTYT